MDAESLSLTSGRSDPPQIPPAVEVHEKNVVSSGRKFRTLNEEAAAVPLLIT